MENLIFIKMIQKILLEKAKIMAAKENIPLDDMIEILDFPFKFLRDKMTESNKKDISTIKNIKIGKFGTFFVPKTVLTSLERKNSNETDLQE